MKWMIAAILVFAAQVAQANVTDSNVVDYLVVERTTAQAIVLQVKIAIPVDRPEYKIAKQKYAAAQQAYNNYTATMLDTYKAGNKIDLKTSAELASSRSKDFADYVASLKIPTRGWGSIFVVVGVLIDIGDKLYTAVTKHTKNERVAFADAVARQVTWEDWDKIGS